MFYGCLGELPPGPKLGLGIIFSYKKAQFVKKILKQAHMRWLSMGVQWMWGAARAYALRVCGGGVEGMWEGGGRMWTWHVQEGCAVAWGIVACLHQPYARRVNLSDSEDCMVARNAIWV
jgi:hypothetical protein